MDTKILVAGFKFKHHSLSSGYHHLSSFVKGDYYDAGKFHFWSDEIDASIGTLGRINFMLFDLFLKSKVNKYQIVHYLYPEQHLFFSNLSSKTVSVATMHLDEKWLNPSNNINQKLIKVRRRAFSKLNGIISLSSDQTNRLKELFPNKRIRFIPHGINKLKHYSDYEDKSKNFYITVAGSNYRDKETFFDIVEYSLVNHPNWKFNLVGVSKDWKVYANKFSNIIVHPYLKEEDYFSVIQSSHVHMLPVKFATANNALLEAHALGVPSLVSNLPGITDYSIDSTSLFTDFKEAISILEKISQLSNSEYKALRENTINGSKKFYWENISVEVENFYKELLETKTQHMKL